MYTHHNGNSVTASVIFDIDTNDMAFVLDFIGENKDYHVTCVAAEDAVHEIESWFVSLRITTPMAARLIIAIGIIEDAIQKGWHDRLDQYGFRSAI